MVSIRRLKIRNFVDEKWFSVCGNILHFYIHTLEFQSPRHVTWKRKHSTARNIQTALIKFGTVLNLLLFLIWIQQDNFLAQIGTRDPRTAWFAHRSVRGSLIGAKIILNPFLQVRYFSRANSNRPSELN